MQTVFTAGQIILGVDPGSRVAGYAFIQAKTATARLPTDFRVLDAGVLRADPALGYAERIALLHGALHGLIARFEPVVCVLEKAFIDKNVSSAMRLGEVRGAFIAAAGRSDVAIAEITPAEVKKTLTGNGRADKEQISLTLKSLLGFERGALPHDVSDAVAIALCYGLRLKAAWAAPTVYQPDAQRRRPASALRTLK
jgi:crossover junction endodeoxyribonuclease RuvC